MRPPPPGVQHQICAACRGRVRRSVRGRWWRDAGALLGCQACPNAANRPRPHWCSWSVMASPPPPVPSCPDGPGACTCQRPARRRLAQWPSESPRWATWPPVYASPLERTRETSAPIAKATGHRVRINRSSAGVRLWRVDRRQAVGPAQDARVDHRAAGPQPLPLSRR